MNNDFTFVDMETLLMTVSLSEHAEHYGYLEKLIQMDYSKEDQARYAIRRWLLRNLKIAVKAMTGECVNLLVFVSRCDDEAQAGFRGVGEAPAQGGDALGARRDEIGSGAAVGRSETDSGGVGAALGRRWQGSAQARRAGATAATRVLGRTRRCDDRRVNDGALGQSQTASHQYPTNLLENLLAQPVLFEQMTKPHHCRLVRNRLASQVNAHERAHRQRVVQRLFHRRVRQIEPQLQAMNPQHSLETRWRAPTSARYLRVKRFDQRTQFLPRNHLVHLSQKLLAARRLAIPLEVARRQGQLLLHHSTSQNPSLPVSVSDISVMTCHGWGFAEIP